MALVSSNNIVENRNENRNDNKFETTRPENVDSSRSTEPDYFIGSNTRQTIQSFQDMEFTFDKQISRIINLTRINQLRRVIITLSQNGGREIRIYSKDGQSILDKNRINLHIIIQLLICITYYNIKKS